MKKCRPLLSKNLRFLGFLSLALCGFSSCSPSSKPQEKALQRPRDEASPAEREQIDSVLGQIEGLTLELGQPHKFRNVPILVTSSNAYQNMAGGCVTVKGIPQFIFLKSEVLQKERELGDGSMDTTLFRILLHEIGHCYFRRTHDDARIFAEEMRIELKVKRHDLDQVRRYPMLDVSVMASDSLALPVELRKYYVAELLGLARAKGLADLAVFAPVAFVPMEGAE